MRLRLRIMKRREGFSAMAALNTEHRPGVEELPADGQRLVMQALRVDGAQAPPLSRPERIKAHRRKGLLDVLIDE